MLVHFVTLRAAHYALQLDAPWRLGNVMRVRTSLNTVTFATFHAAKTARTANVTKAANAHQAALPTSTVHIVNQNALSTAYQLRTVLAATTKAFGYMDVFRALRRKTVKQVSVYKSMNHFDHMQHIICIPNLNYILPTI